MVTSNCSLNLLLAASNKVACPTLVDQTDLDMLNTPVTSTFFAPAVTRR